MDESKFNQGVKLQLRSIAAATAAASLALGLGACGGDDNASSTGSGSGESKLSGNINIDGSSTVFPFAQAAAELFNEEQPDVKVKVGQAGTGGGFKSFCRGETDISNASRPIKDDEEAPVCKKSGVSYSQLQVANDGIAVVSNKALEVKCLTTKQLKSVFNKGSKVTALNQVDKSLPATKLKVYGPGPDSGTFDYFTAEINGEEKVHRKNYSPSENDSQLVTGIEAEAGGFGYFGFSYYEADADKLNLVSVNAGKGCIAPSKETIQDGTYKPLARPLFMYPSKKAMEKPQVKAFMEFVLANHDKIAEAAKIVPMNESQAAAANKKLAS